MKPNPILVFRVLLASMVACGAAPSIAAVSAEEATKLKTVLTPMGAERAGNKEGTIPAWDGKMPAQPATVKNGDMRPDPFAAEKPRLTITAKNMAEYASMLSDGTKALLERFPSFRLDVYPTHRTGIVPSHVYDATAKNAEAARTENEGQTLVNAKLGIPFPIPRNGYEAMWNHQLSYRGEMTTFTADKITVTASGDMVLGGRQSTVLIYPYYASAAPAETNGEFARARLDTLEPPVAAGQSLLAIEYLDKLGRPKDAWQLLPGQRRVRKAPSLAYDAPDMASNGITRFDEVYLFIGAMDRYDMKLVGKREMLVPYNNNGMPLKPLNDVVGKKHLSPAAVRWELHRVWVVEATLKPGKRNVAAKRRFYLDEDTWQAVLTDTWDAQGSLWKVGQAFTLIAPDQQTASTVPYVFYDLIGGTYVYIFAFNETGGIIYDKFDSKALLNFSPSALASGGVR